MKHVDSQSYSALILAAQTWIRQGALLSKVNGSRNYKGQGNSQADNSRPSDFSGLLLFVSKQSRLLAWPISDLDPQIIVQHVYGCTYPHR